MQRNLIIVWVGLIVGCSACTPHTPAETDRPPDRFVGSRVPWRAGGDILIAAQHRGGGAGDTTYRLLACPKGTSSCEILGNIDTGDHPRPQLSLIEEKVVLTVNRSDGIWAFENFSRALPSWEPARIELTYR